MKLVIDIPEEIYKASQILDVKYEATIQMPIEVIAKGTPLKEKQTNTEEATNDDIETMRILFDADINEYCNQGRWNEAKEYEQIRDRLMTALKKTNTAEWEE